MSFFEDRFPPCISLRARGGPMWSTSTTTLLSGKTFSNRNFVYPIHSYDVAQAVKTNSDFEEVRAFFYVVYGAFDGFRYKDWTDYKVTHANGRLTLVSGSNYQMFRRYQFGVRTFDRQIQKPVGGTVVVHRTRSGVVTTATASVNTATGVVAITGHVSGDTYTWAGEFDVPVKFQTDLLDAEVVDRNGAGGDLLLTWSSVL
jgi:uncharacterized protein (TIGR02217 family)